MRFEPTRWFWAGQLLFCALVSSSPAFARPAARGPIKVSPDDLFRVTDADGRAITCAKIKRTYLPGSPRPRGKFMLLSNEVKILAGKVRIASGKKRKRLSKKLKSAKARLRASTQTCAAGPGGLEEMRGPLSESDVRYLYEKAALGAVPPEAMEIGTSQGAGPLVDYLLRYSRDSDLETEAARYLDENYAEDSGSVTNRGVHMWALKILIGTRNPFHERLAFLFLHNILATSMEAFEADSQRPLMVEHLNKIRAHSVSGDYRSLVKEIARDPVMLIWLNGNQNTKQQPNENFARELMELFTLSPADDSGTPNYSELTVAQVARACTGWTVQSLRLPDGQRIWSAVFGSAIHDDDPDKIVFEGRAYQAAVENDFDVVDHILDSHPNAPRFLATKILEEYLREDPPAALRDALASVVKESDFNVLAAMAKLLKSRAFYAPENRNTIIKNPTERIVELLRKVPIPFDIGSLQRSLEGAGQQIGMPPTVFGWDNRDWANGQWLLNLSNIVTGIVRNDSLFNRQAVPFGYEALLPRPAATGREVVSHLEALLGIVLTDEQESALEVYMNNRLTNNAALVPDPWDPANPAKVRRKVAGLIEILFRTNDFQMR